MQINLLHTLATLIVSSVVTNAFDIQPHSTMVAIGHGAGVVAEDWRQARAAKVDDAPESSNAPFEGRPPVPVFKPDD